jgi:myo-inositol-1(or 4)-monophosphatase
MTEYLRLLAVAQQAVDIAQGIMLTGQPGLLTAKGDRDMASEVDFAIERKLRHFLADRTPAVGFLGEEDGLTGGSGNLVWVLDPVDGTVNFVHGSPLCAISLGLLDGDRAVVGVVAIPFLDLRYSAVSGDGAFCGERRISASGEHQLRDAVVAIGDYAVGDDACSRNSARLAITARLVGQAQRIRMHGSAAIDLVWLAEGRLDAVIMMSNKPWDTAAGVVIAREAGACVVDLDGSPHTAHSGATIAADQLLMPELLQLVSEASYGGP